MSYLLIITLLICLVIILSILTRDTGDSVDVVKKEIEHNTRSVNLGQDSWSLDRKKCTIDNFDCEAQSLAPMKIYAGGSGEDMLSQPETASEIIALSEKERPNVLYLGTATYDSSDGFAKQTHQFSKRNCPVASLDVSRSVPNAKDIIKLFDDADIILISGGNTLFAVDRWNQLGIDKLIRQSLMQGKVLCGGSAGGIVWFDGGHSDSMDPSTYLNPPGPVINKALTKKELDKSWAYIRVPGLSILPGLFCPHYDKVEGNGQLRATNFSDMMKLHSGETGIALDNWSAMKINGSTYEIVSRDGKHGSVGANGEYVSDSKKGRPGGWRLEVDPITGKVMRTLLPTVGDISSILTPAKYVVQSQMLSVARMQNPLPQ